MDFPKTPPSLGSGLPLGLPLELGFGTTGPIWVWFGSPRGGQSRMLSLLCVVVDALSLLKRKIQVSSDEIGGVFRSEKPID